MRFRLLIVLTIACAGSLAGQSASALRVGMSQPSPVRRPLAAAAAVKDSLPKTRWLEGTVIGGVLGLVGGLQLQHQTCNSDSPCSSSADKLWFVIPTMVFAVIGGLIGSAIHKH